MADQIQVQQREQVTDQILRNVEPENDGKGKTQMDLEVPKETNSARDSKHGNSEDPGEKSSEYSEEGNSKDFIEKRNSEYPGNGNPENSGSRSSDGPQQGNTTDPGDGKSVGLEKVNSEESKKENSKYPQKGNFVVSGTGNSVNPREVSHRDLNECSLHTHTAAITSQCPQVVGKRPGDQSHEFDYDDRSKKQKVDSKDGNNIATAQEFRSSHHNESELRLTCVSERMEHPTRIWSESSGGFLRANKRNERSVHIPVDFSVKKPEQTTEFYIEKNNKYEANTFRCSLGDQQYYLCTEEENVFLLKTNACDPNDDKFLFTIAFINAESRFSTIKSVKTEMYLVSDENGNASMRTIKDLKGGQPKDRQAWFFIDDHDDMVTDSMLTIFSEDMLTFTAKTYGVY